MTSLCTHPLTQFSDELVGCSTMIGLVVGNIDPVQVSSVYGDQVLLLCCYSAQYISN